MTHQTIWLNFWQICDDINDDEYEEHLQAKKIEMGPKPDAKKGKNCSFAFIIRGGNSKYSFWKFHPA
jgi:hypothetical protein